MATVEVEADVKDHFRYIFRMLDDDDSGTQAANERPLHITHFIASRVCQERSRLPSSSPRPNSLASSSAERNSLR